MRRLAPLALLTLLALPLPAAPAFADEARWSRRVEVARPGPVVVELDGRAAEWAEIDLQVIAPDGRVVPASLHGEAAGARRANVTGVAPDAAGWRIEIDTGAAPPRHIGLRFALARDTAAGNVLLEGSDDGATWRELARGDLFRLGSARNLQDFVLSYEPTEVRWLRLAWPAAAGLPELSDIATLPSAEPGGEKRKIETSCGGGQGRDGYRFLDCAVRLPLWCRGLEVELAPRESPLGFRLWRAVEGTWQSLGAGERRRHGLLRFELTAGAFYNFRLESPAEPTLVQATCEQRRSQLHFLADAAGSYQVTYGRLTAPERRLDCLACDEAPPAGELLPLGKEVEGAAPAWPKSAEPGAPLKGKLDRSWPVHTEATAGQLVELRLPEAVVTGAGLAPVGLRLDAHGAQLPFLSEIYPRPQALAVGEEKVPVGRDGGRSRIEIRVPGMSGEGQLFLFARGPFERTVRFLQPDPTPGRPGEVEIAPAARWVCPASLVVECELQATLLFQPRPAAAGPWAEGDRRAIQIELDDGDNPPLPVIEADLWTRWPVFYFIHPGQPVVLREGQDLAAPRYDFASLGPLLHRDEAVEAFAMDSPPGEGGATEAPRWLLLAVIGIAALALLAVLARILRQGPA